ncbi:hypothetical protein AB3S75_006940 [Citrus x aurantiifolia]
MCRWNYARPNIVWFGLNILYNQNSEKMSFLVITCGRHRKHFGSIPSR